MLDSATVNPAVAQAAGLTYVNDNDPGIRRKRAGKGFSYRLPDGSILKDKAEIDRINKLAIPPAYQDVWISPDPSGHIQATGRDEKGRKQYRYHADWRAARDETKFARMAAFGRALPALRAQVDKDMSRRGLPREKVVAAVVRLLELTLIRIGNDEYAKTNKSFGLTTMRDRHAKIEGGEIRFSFTGKSGVKHSTGLKDRRLAKVVKACQDVPGQRLFQYFDDDGQRRSIESADINAYLREVTGEDFTAKDFRTWAGTVAAAKALALQPPPQSPTEAKRVANTCVKAVAGLLGNTPAVCRSAYIHPAVLTAFHDELLPESFAHAEGADYEAAVLEFLDGLAQDVEERTGLTPEEQVDASSE